MADLSAVFNIEFDAIPAASIQWHIGDGAPESRTPILGATNKTLTIRNVNRNMNGDAFSCLIKNRNGEVWSELAVLTVFFAPLIAQDPQSQEKSLGETLSLTVVADPGNPEETAYKWFKNGILISDGGRISGATTPTLTITSYESGDAGIYHAEVSNTIGSATSDSAEITSGEVLFPPTIFNQPNDAALSLGDTLNLSVFAAGSEPLTYQWYKGITPLSNGGRIVGADTDNLIITDFESGDVGQYSVVVSNDQGSEASDVANVTEIPTEDLWFRSFAVTESFDSMLETDDTSFYPYANKRVTVPSIGMTITMDYHLVVGSVESAGLQWSRGIAVADYSNINKDRSTDQAANSTIAGGAWWSAGLFGWTYLWHGNEANQNVVLSDTGLRGNEYSGTTTIIVGPLKINGMRDISVIMNVPDLSILGETSTFEDAITGSDMLVMVSAAGDTFDASGLFVVDSLSMV